jgi:hypothetical protein
VCYRDKYVVGDDYLPSWKVPSFSKYMNTLGFSFTDTLNTYIRSVSPGSSIKVFFTDILTLYLFVRFLK